LLETYYFGRTLNADSFGPLLIDPCGIRDLNYADAFTYCCVAISAQGEETPKIVIVSTAKMVEVANRFLFIVKNPPTAIIDNFLPTAIWTKSSIALVCN
jgi:hypothetical protein